MKKSVRIGIIATIIVILTVVSIDILLQIDDFKKSANEPTKNIGNEISQESKPIGKDLSINLEEKMGFTAP
jgi:hypothetical protein